MEKQNRLTLSAQRVRTMLCHPASQGMDVSGKGPSSTRQKATSTGAPTLIPTFWKDLQASRCPLHFSLSCRCQKACSIWLQQLQSNQSIKEIWVSTGASRAAQGALLSVMGSLMGGASGGERIHVYVWLSVFTVHLKLSPLLLLIGYTPI